MNSIATMMVAMVLLAFAGSAHADATKVQRGLYAVNFRLELPHLERYAITRTSMVCVDPPRRPEAVPIPVIGGNGAFKDCSIENARWDAGNYSYNIVCAGRAAARASASYRLTPEGFSGRVTMVLGAKNMTMTEVQDGQRIGNCNVVDVRENKESS